MAVSPITYFPARPNVDFTEQDPTRQMRQGAEVVNKINRGQFNCSAMVTLVANAATTTLLDSRISFQTAVLFMPTTANAAAEIGNGTLWVVCTAGTGTVHHANNAQTDRIYTVVFLG